MLDEHDADGYEPEHDQYLDNGDDLSRLFAGEEDDFDAEPGSVEARDGQESEEPEEWQDGLDPWDDDF